MILTGDIEMNKLAYRWLYHFYSEEVDKWWEFDYGLVWLLEAELAMIYREF